MMTNTDKHDQSLRSSLSSIERILKEIEHQNVECKEDEEVRVRVRVPFGRKLILNEDELIAELVAGLRTRLASMNAPCHLVSILIGELVEDLVKDQRFLGQQTEAILARLRHSDTLTCLDVLECKFLAEYLSVKLRSRVNDAFSDSCSLSSHAIRNRRNHMEDFFVNIDRVKQPFTGQLISLGLVVDGHAGADVALYVIRMLPYYILTHSQGPIDRFTLKSIFKHVQAQICQHNSQDRLAGGCTASLALVCDDFLYVCWLGDTAIYLVDEQGSIRFRSTPHKPNRKDELDRINKLGGVVSKCSGIFRINGSCAVSRSFGDLHMQPYVSSELEIDVFRLNDDIFYLKYAVIGTDGFCDHCSEKEMLDILYETDSGQISTDACVRRLISVAQNNKSSDNICVTVMNLLIDRTRAQSRWTKRPTEDVNLKSVNTANSFVNQHRSSALFPRRQRLVLCDEEYRRGCASD